MPKQSSANTMIGGSYDNSPQEDIDPWAAAAALLANDNSGGGDGWNDDSINAVIYALKQKGKGKEKGGKGGGCWECGGNHKRSECLQYTAKWEQWRAENGGAKGGGKQGGFQPGVFQN